MEVVIVTASHGDFEDKMGLLAEKVLKKVSDVVMTVVITVVVLSAVPGPVSQLWVRPLHCLFHPSRVPVKTK